MKTGAIIAAAGSGMRMGGVWKAMMEIGGKRALQHCLEAFAEIPSIAHVVLVVPPGTSTNQAAWPRDKQFTIIEGGALRADSVRNGLAAMPRDIDVVVIHDVARPLVSAALIQKVIDVAVTGISATVAVPVTDTLHVLDDDYQIVGTPDRSQFWRAQTPQAFPREALQAAFRQVTDASYATDEAGLVARAGLPVRVVMGESWNVKLTTPEDVALAEAALARRQH